MGNVSDEDWPIFCYENEWCDGEDLETGLFRGIYLLRTFRRIFTGPKSVTSGQPGPVSKRKSIAQILGMTKVTPRSIAYAAVQARFTLSDKEEWHEVDGNFDYRRFYESIVSVFESNPDLPWVKKTLIWWNQ
ncbi:hypothetical protein BC826DRAFT_923149 [Russula brevipes]|nr:hypothetical protein BC826DRAFT_923149 [Russula brevipes]